MAISGLNSPYSGMMAAQTRQNMTANNVANVNTPGFQPQTQTAAPAQQPAASPAYINNVGQAGAAQPTASTYAPPRPSASTATPPPAAAQAAAPTTPTAMTQNAPTTAAPQMSNVDMITETANRMNTQNAYGANAASAQGMNGMMQTLMDMVG